MEPSSTRILAEEWLIFLRKYGKYKKYERYKKKMINGKLKNENLDALRHSCAHVLAAAVLELYPKVKNTIGPSIENGFYYDFDFADVKITEEDFPKIEKMMKQLLKDWGKFERQEVTQKRAKDHFKSNEYKIELIEELAGQGQALSLYKSGNFIDLCRGGHIENPSKELNHFKLMSIAGAYWRGSEKNKMLTRIYGTAFSTQEELTIYLEQLEEARKRDHRKIGASLGLWTFSDMVGSGLPLFTPKGTIVRQLINGFVEDLQSKQGIQQVWTPQIAKAELFKKSGHYDKYKEDMFRVKSNYSDEEFFLKPMNCPQHTQIYASTGRSYRDLPIRYADFAMLYRDERPGELLGLTRTRGFSQDDCHIFCRESQVKEEMNKAIAMTKQIMDAYGFEYKYRLSVRDPKQPKKYLGEPKNWDKAEKLSEEVLKENKIEYFLGVGEAAFYAPKLDLIATDSIGREHQLSTLQIDYVLPERFGLTYTDEKGEAQTPVMLHRAISGSPERLMAILLEHYAGAFPVWLAPVQAKILPISDKHVNYAQFLEHKFSEKGLRVEVDSRSETLQSRIRDAQLQKIPYMLIVGNREEENKTVSVRPRTGEDLGALSQEEFLSRIKHIVEAKTGL